MRVRLTYSVELEEVPENVADLIDDEWESISFCDHLISECIDYLKSEEPSVKQSLKKIDKVRKRLAVIDTRLDECSSLLQGYETAIETTESQSEPKSPEPTAENTKSYSEYNTPYEIPKESQK